MMTGGLVSILLLLQTNAAMHSPAAGPANGYVIPIGGGLVGPEILNRFAKLAGGLDAPIVVIPTAGDADTYGEAALERHPLRKHGFTRLKLLHTRERRVADTEAFAAVLKTAKGVWFDGGRQWRLVDSYLDTRTHREMEALLQRGGVIAGTSAGATIQGSYLVRGAREGNTIMMAKGYEQGLGFLSFVAIDQHLIKRKRENDMLPVVALKPELLGLGLDEGTAVVVHGTTFDVMGVSKVAIYDANYGAGPDGKGYYFLSPGDCFDIAKRKQIACAVQ
ncbi:MAG: cyanophycinase [Bryobacterales bacterium]|nr:cyanophycinase [Bryobacterales bacterium]